MREENAKHAEQTKDAKGAKYIEAYEKLTSCSAFFRHAPRVSPVNHTSYL